MHKLEGTGIVLLRIRRSLVTLLAAGALLGVTAVGCGPTPPSPTVSWHFLSSVAVGEAPRLVYATANIPNGSRIYVQRTLGTSPALTTVTSVPVLRTGAVTLPAVPMGRYTYRLAVVNAQHKVLTAPTHLLTSYGTVAIQTILGSSAHVVTVGTRLYTYTWDESFSMDRTSCRRLDLTAVPYAAYLHAPVTLSVLQETAAAESVTLKPMAITSFHANLTGGPFRVAAPTGVVGNGTASCWSPDGTD